MYTLLLITIFSAGTPSKVVEVKNLTLQQCVAIKQAKQTESTFGYCEKQPAPAEPAK